MKQISSFNLWWFLTNVKKDLKLFPNSTQTNLRDT